MTRFFEDFMTCAAGVSPEPRRRSPQFTEEDPKYRASQEAAGVRHRGTCRNRSAIEHLTAGSLAHSDELPLTIRWRRWGAAGCPARLQESLCRARSVNAWIWSRLSLPQRRRTDMPTSHQPLRPDRHSCIGPNRPQERWVTTAGRDAFVDHGRLTARAGEDPCCSRHSRASTLSASAETRAGVVIIHRRQRGLRRTITQVPT